MQIVEPIDWATFANKPSMLPEKQSRILSKVIEAGDIKIAQMSFKEGKLDTSPMVIIYIIM